jgi:hypothetical protein
MRSILNPHHCSPHEFFRNWVSNNISYIFFLFVIYLPLNPISYARDKRILKHKYSSRLSTLRKRTVFSVLFKQWHPNALILSIRSVQSYIFFSIYKKNNILSQVFVWKLPTIVFKRTIDERPTRNTIYSIWSAFRVVVRHIYFKRAVPWNHLVMKTAD